jgi:hypothetical protein
MFTRVVIPSLGGVDLTRETTRQYMAYGALYGFLLLLATIIIGGWLWRRINIDEVTKILTTTSSVLSGVVGAVVGFYFRGED